MTADNFEQNLYHGTGAITDVTLLGQGHMEMVRGASARPGTSAIKETGEEVATRTLSLATKYSKEGKAVHRMIGVEAKNGSTMWFDQTAAAGAKEVSPGLFAGTGEFNYVKNGPNKSYAVSNVSLPANQVENAATKAKSMVGANTYNPVTNSCVFCARGVMKAAGVKTNPFTFTPGQLEKISKEFLQDKVVSHVKKV